MHQPESTKALRVGLIGYGGIGRQVADALASGAAGDVELCGVLVRTPPSGPVRAPFFTDIQALLGRAPRVVIEAASQAAVAAYAEPILQSGATLVLASTAAMLDEPLRERLQAICRKTSARVILAAGALGAVDALASASVGGLGHVVLRVVEPGPAKRILFHGSAADGARQFPGHLNVAATALIAAHTDVSVTLEQHPGGQNVRLIELTARGPFGEFTAHLHPVPDPARLTHIVALSLIAVVRRVQQPIQLG